MRNPSKALLAFCALSTAAGIARADLLTNGSFETPVVPTGNFTTYTVGSVAITGWTVIGPTSTNVAIVSTTFVQNGVTFEAEDGSQWLDLTGLSSNTTEGVQQTVTTAPGTNYALTFFIGNTTGGGIFGTTTTDALYINGSEVNTYENSTADATGLNWEQFTYNFVAAGASTTIGFVNLDPGSDNSNGLDLVDLELGTGATVPEPATIGLVGSALLVLAFRKRRKA